MNGKLEVCWFLRETGCWTLRAPATENASTYRCIRITPISGFRTYNLETRSPWIVQHALGRDIQVLKITFFTDVMYCATLLTWLPALWISPHLHRGY